MPRVLFHSAALSLSLISLFPLAGLEPSDDESDVGPAGCDTSLTSALALMDDEDASTQLYLVKKQLR